MPKTGELPLTGPGAAPVIDHNLSAEIQDWVSKKNRLKLLQEEVKNAQETIIGMMLARKVSVVTFYINDDEKSAIIIKVGKASLKVEKMGKSEVNEAA